MEEKYSAELFSDKPISKTGKNFGIINYLNKTEASVKSKRHTKIDAENKMIIFPSKIYYLKVNIFYNSLNGHFTLHCWNNCWEAGMVCLVSSVAWVDQHFTAVRSLFDQTKTCQYPPGQDIMQNLIFEIMLAYEKWTTIIFCYPLILQIYHIDYI